MMRNYSIQWNLRLLATVPLRMRLLQNQPLPCASPGTAFSYLAQMFNMTRLTLVLGLLLVESFSAVLGVDLTIEEGSSGADVVLATIAKIESSGIFSSDKRLLRRIAYVETEDGVEKLPEPNGGVWNVPMEAFTNTQRDPDSASIREDINAAFMTELAGIGVRGWEDLEWKALSRPLFSGLAARLLISAAVERNASVPTSSDVSGQAQFWRTWYNPSGDVIQFVADVELLEKDEGIAMRHLKC